MTDISLISKNQRRKQKKAQWLADRKSMQIAEGIKVSRRKRRNERQTRMIENESLSAIVHYKACTSTTCNNRIIGNNCIVRSIEPYLHHFALYVKGRWAGRTLCEIFADEFPTLSTEYCVRAAQLGLIRVNGNNVLLDTVINAGDFFEHIKHRHEPDVHLPLQNVMEMSTLSSLSETWIHAETDELMVVNKPSGVPVHPTGNYQFNSLTLMLEHDRRDAAVKKKFQTFELFPVHRLDRLTSGLLILAKTPDKARSLSSELSANFLDGDADYRSVQKFYVARVKGEFPTTASGFARLTSKLVKIVSASDEFWRVTAPIGLMSPRQGHKRCVIASPDSKSCMTLLRRRGTPIGGESIVECLLVTGRTHQIRVHLQHLGFPIVNDPLYGPENNDKQTKAALEQVSSILHPTAKSFNFKEEILRNTEDKCVQACEICTAEHKKDVAVDVGDANLWLHSYRYESANWKFEVPLPQWAKLYGTIDTCQPDT
ncbi:rna pseudouridylate [Plasmopara halstedii]|uniref:Rna pseudouridylate n=1 Tax=Plasmopara halstedii TaxID=4781 RepID=A0A0P1AZS7_PLAHL|nr:rna pseudouridylate [Plasmopara halstedii]CEG47992.1 rna pseudouridylate [Plasmopara halstedii]|eukprot:XP_024584361.1 rna pseudouridylate [Plasmopara halstedii]